MDYLKSLFKVKNKVVVITGGSGILGTEMARGLLRAGAKVILLARNKENLKKKVAVLKKSGSVVIGLQCDVTVEENLRNVNDNNFEKVRPYRRADQRRRRKRRRRDDRP